MAKKSLESGLRELVEWKAHGDHVERVATNPHPKVSGKMCKKKRFNVHD